MAGSTTLKQYLAAVKDFFSESKNPPATPRVFGVVMGSKFADSLARHTKVFPDLHEKLKKFIDMKQADPLHAKYGKHDSPFKSGTPLVGYMHCHLRDDAILIYTLKNRAINLLLICNHADIEGSRKNRTASVLAAA